MCVYPYLQAISIIIRYQSLANRRDSLDASMLLHAEMRLINIVKLLIGCWRTNTVRLKKAEVSVCACVRGVCVCMRCVCARGIVCVGAWVSRNTGPAGCLLGSDE